MNLIFLFPFEANVNVFILMPTFFGGVCLIFISLCRLARCLVPKMVKKRVLICFGYFKPIMGFFDEKEAELMRKYYQEHPKKLKELMERLKLVNNPVRRGRSSSGSPSYGPYMGGVGRGWFSLTPFFA